MSATPSHQVAAQQRIHQALLLREVGHNLVQTGSCPSEITTNQQTGDHTQNVSNQEKMKGIGTPHFDEKHADQKMGESGAVGKAFNAAHYGNDKGK